MCLAKDKHSLLATPKSHHTQPSGYDILHSTGTLHQNSNKKTQICIMNDNPMQYQGTGNLLKFGTKTNTS